MAKKLLYIFISVITLGGWGNSESVNIYPEPRALPDRAIYRYGAEGEALKLSDFSEPFIVANFWSRHCSPCIRELDDLNEFSKKVSENGIKVVIISPASEWQDIEEQQKFLARFHGQDLDFYVDKKGDLSADLGIFTSPNTVLVSNGKEIGRIRGSADWDDDDVIEYIYKIKAQQNKKAE